MEPVSSEQTDELVGTGAAAQRLGVSRTTLTRWVAAGAITPAARTLGGHMRWDLDKLRAELQQLGAEFRSE